MSKKSWKNHVCIVCKLSWTLHPCSVSHDRWHSANKMLVRNFFLDFCFSSFITSTIEGDWFVIAAVSIFQKVHSHLQWAYSSFQCNLLKSSKQQTNDQGGLVSASRSIWTKNAKPLVKKMPNRFKKCQTSWSRLNAIGFDMTRLVIWQKRSGARQAFIIAYNTTKAIVH